MFKGKKNHQREKNSNLILETLNFLNQKIDIILGKSELLCELLDDIDDPIIIELLNKKLTSLEKELNYIEVKLDLEKNNFKQWKKTQ